MLQFCQISAGSGSRFRLSHTCKEYMRQSTNVWNLLLECGSHFVGAFCQINAICNLNAIISWNLQLLKCGRPVCRAGDTSKGSFRGVRSSLVEKRPARDAGSAED